MDLVEMLSTIWRAKWIILATAVVAGGLVLYNSLRQEKVFRASTMLVVGTLSPGASGLGASGGEDKLALSYAELIRVNDVLDKARDIGGLDISNDQLAVDVGSYAPPKDVSTPYLKLFAASDDPQSAIDEVNAISQALVEYIAGMQNKVLEDDRNSVVNQLAQVEGEIAKIQAAPAKDPARLAGLEDVRRTLIDNFYEVATAGMPGANLRIVDPANVAVASSPNTIRNTGLALVFGALAGVGTGFAAESFRKAWRRESNGSTA